MTRSEASRANGAKSKGPKTPQGKKNSSMNAVKHGMTARYPIFTNEDRTKFENHRQEFYDEWQPQSPSERACIERMVMSLWRENRGMHWEAAMIDLQMDKQRAEIAEKYDGPLDPPTYTVTAVRIIMDETTAFDRLQRYEARAQRTYDRALKQLLQLQDRREKRERPNRKNSERERSESEPPQPQTTDHRSQTTVAKRPLPSKRTQQPTENKQPAKSPRKPPKAA